jgi:hexosaminidase
VALETELIADIYYTLDGTVPTVSDSTQYKAPFTLEKSKTIQAIAVKDGKIMGEPESKKAILHKARGAQVTLDPEPQGKYSAKGGYTLVDCDFGGDKWGNGKWLGVLGTDFTATMEFDQAMEISKIGYSCIEETAAGIYFPSRIEILVSEDGKDFKTAKVWNANRKTPIAKTSDIKTQVLELDFEPTTCKYVKVKTSYQKVKNTGVFVFVDEILVY